MAGVREYAIFMLDVDGIVVSWNLGAQRIKGYARARDHRPVLPGLLPARGPGERSPGGQPGPCAPQRRARRGGLASPQGRQSLLGERGDQHGVRRLRHAHRLRQGDPRPECAGQHEQDLATPLHQQTQFLSVTAHELRTPTAVIEGSATALEESGDEIPAPAKRSSPTSAARPLASEGSPLTSATASQVQRGTFRYEWEDVAVIQLLQRAVARAQRRRERRSPRSRAATVPRVRADSVRLAQAVDNLLDNALRHGKPPVTLGCSVDEGTVQIRVTDCGAGVPGGWRRTCSTGSPSVDPRRARGSASTSCARSCGPTTARWSTTPRRRSTQRVRDPPARRWMGTARSTRVRQATRPK